MNANETSVGIIGSGIVGQVLARAFAAEGHEVMLGTRNPAKEELVKWKEANHTIQLGTFEEVAVFGKVIVLATQGAVAEEAIKMAGIQQLTGKIIIDATNPISQTHPPVNGVLQYFTGPNESLMERLQKLAPHAYWVKAFNSVGNAFMYKPAFEGTRPTMFICGDKPEAKTTVKQILDRFGWESEDMGRVESARAIEPLCILWCLPGLIRNQWTHAFKLLKM